MRLSLKNNRWQAPLLVTAASLLVLALYRLWLHLTIHSVFAVDEFTYMHQAWLISKGQVMYRDFIGYHLPLLSQVGAIPFLLFGDSPDKIIYLRLTNHILFIPALIALGIINRSRGLATAILTAGTALSIPLFLSIIEFRPDTIAFACFAVSLGFLFAPRLSDRIRAFASGIFLILACWANVKAVVYGSVFFPIFLFDLFYNKRRMTPSILRDPLMFLWGAVTMAGILLLYLTATNSLDGLIAHVASYNDHEKFYPGFSWMKYFHNISYWNRWLLFLASIGILETVWSGRHEKIKIWQKPDLVVLLSLGSTFMSHYIQTASFYYSLIPFIGISSVMAARGVHALVKGISRLPKLSVPVRLAFISFLLLYVASIYWKNYEYLRYRAYNTRTNDIQIDNIKLINELTHPGDPVYDQSAAYVIRPHAVDLFATDLATRRNRARQLIKNVPADIEKRECVAMMTDFRFSNLPSGLKMYLYRNFVRYSPSIWLWGSRFGPTQKDSFKVIKEGTYFIYPPEIVNDGKLRIDNKPIQTVEFNLKKGEWKVEYSGKSKQFYILRLPADGARYVPMGASV